MTAIWAGILAAMILLAAVITVVHLWRDASRRLDRIQDPGCDWCRQARYVPADCTCTQVCGHSYCMRRTGTAP